MVCIVCQHKTLTEKCTKINLNFSALYSFLFWVCFCLVHPVLVLVSVSSREASFFFSFASPVGPLRSLPERCWPLRWPLTPSAEADVSSIGSCRPLTSDSSWSQISSVTPESNHKRVLLLNSAFIPLKLFSHLFILHFTKTVMNLLTWRHKVVHNCEVKEKTDDFPNFSQI